jgi:hypothetical protein
MEFQSMVWGVRRAPFVYCTYPLDGVRILDCNTKLVDYQLY